MTKPMDDLISRQAAIKAVYDLPNCYNGYSDTYDKAWIIGLLGELPSAQPEPIKINIDHELTKDEYEKLRKDMADAPIVLLPTAEPELANNSPKVENENGDLISRQAALDAINSGMLTDDDTQFECPSECNSMLEWAVNAVKELPTADLSEYSDKLWKTAYERGKAEAHPKKGKWIPVTNGRGGHECDQCHEYAPSWQTGEEHLTNYCPNCGARMEESE